MKHPNPAIFINYRRALSTLEARLLYLMLQFRFPGQVFIDEQTLEAGDRWRPAIEDSIKNAKLMISLIPEGWVGHLDELGIHSKLYYDPKCHVRHEIKTALQAGVTIIPVLINGAGLAQPAKATSTGLFPQPLEEEFPLPADLAELLPAAESPYVGLRPFRRADARLFFGRSREIYHLCFKVVRQKKPRLLLLDGYSGTGKSSLLQAGLIPRVEGQGWAVTYRRREEEPIQGLPGVFAELVFFWVETNYEDGSFAAAGIKQWLESNLLSETLKAEGRQLAFPFEKTAVRQWLQRVDPNRYAGLLKKYYAPTDAVMVKVPGGELEIGEDKDKRLAEVNTFRLANVTVTWWEYGLFLYAADRQSELKEQAPNWGINGDHPVVNISWYDAVEYCNWLSERWDLEKVYRIDKTRKDPNNSSDYDKIKWLVERVNGADGYRLPTEIEWEFAARGGLQSKGFRYAGSDQLDELGWYAGNANGKTHPAGRKKPNELGLYDMSGNVWDWCWEDWYDSYPESLPKGFSGAVTGEYRVLRGGSWLDFGDVCRVSFRFRNYPTLRNYNYGFRLAQDSS